MANVVVAKLFLQVVANVVVAKLFLQVVANVVVAKVVLVVFFLLAKPESRKPESWARAELFLFVSLSALPAFAPASPFVFAFVAPSSPATPPSPLRFEKLVARVFCFNSTPGV